MMQLLKQWSSVIVLLFILKGSAFAGGIIFYTSNGSPYINVVQYETYTAPSAHLSYITVKGGQKTQIQSAGIIANIPLPATGGEYSLEDIQTNIAQADAMASRQPKYAQAMQKVSQLWNDQIPAAEALLKRRLAEETAAKTAAEALQKRRLAEEAAAKKKTEENNRLAVEAEMKEQETNKRLLAEKEQKEQNKTRPLSDNASQLNVDKIKEAACQGDPEAQYTLGLVYVSGNGDPSKQTAENSEKAVEWFRKAAENNHVKAQFILATCYDTGEGVVKDLTEAIKWYKKAAEQGSPEAQYNLGCLFYEGVDGIKNQSDGLKLLQQSADQGFQKSILALQQLYKSNLELRPEFQAAKTFFTTTLAKAESGDSDAQYNLGKLYETGNGTTQDSKEAVKWYSKAAVLDCQKAQEALGDFLYSGRNGSIDFAEAAKWYEKSEEKQGNALVELHLAQIYFNGIQVKKDLNKAWNWISKSSSNGSKIASIYIEKHPDVRNKAH